MTKLTREQFINKVSPLAIESMNKYNISASLIIAQAILESGNGNSSLTVEANNLFGIKGSGTNGTISKATTEYVNGKSVIVNANFRKYNNWQESVDDHAKLFINGVSWNPKLYHNVIGKRGNDSAIEVQKSGYATDPNYSNKLIELMKNYNLYKYDVVNKCDSCIEFKKLKDEIKILSEKLKEIEPPKWVINEFPEITEVTDHDFGSFEYWRAIVTVLRYIKMYLK